MSSVVLIGLMGTGKTTVGKMLARQLNKPFVDVDILIEEKLGMTISEVFDEYGEPYFRKIEKEMISEISKSDDVIVAAGGGAVLDDGNMASLKKMGHLIHLFARSEIILKRIGNQHHRPLLETADREERVARLLEQRGPYYDRADTMIDTSDLEVKDVVAKIIACLQELRHG
jgi:shikimate kinase